MTEEKVIPVIIVTYNQLYKFTIPCVESILKNTRGLKFHIIIVDNCSTDNTIKELESRYSSETLTVIESGSNLGWDGGNIKGIEFMDEHFDYEMFVLLNSDTVVSADWLGRMVSILKKNKKAVSVVPVEIVRKENYVKYMYNSVSDNSFIKFIINYSPLCFLKEKCLAQPREDKPALDSRGVASVESVEAVNVRLMKENGESFEVLPTVESGYCVLLKKSFKERFLFYLKNFAYLFKNKQYWTDVKQRQDVDYMRAKGVYVYHFRGGSGGY